MQVIGVDAGASWIKAGIFSAGGVAERTVRLPSGASQGRQAYLASIAAAVQELGGGEAIGVAVPGSLSRDRRFIRGMANVAGQSLHQAPVDLQRELGELLGVSRLAFDNDANCAALAEWQYGVGEGAIGKSLLHLTWGTGIGTGFVSGGQAHYGWEGGHMPLTWTEQSDTACNCGSRIDVEAFCSVPHMLRRTQQWIEEGRHSTTMKLEDFSDLQEGAKILLQQAKAGDKLAQHIFIDSLRWLGRSLIMMSVLSYPEVIAIGGGMMADDWLLLVLRQQIEEQATGYVLDAISPEHVYRAQLGNEAGMMGAALLVLRESGR